MAQYQTNYTEDFAPGYAGMIVNGETSNRISRTLEDATALPFGKAVFRGATEHGCTGTPDAAKLMGISIAKYATNPVEATGEQGDFYVQRATVGILTTGVIWVVSSVTVAAAGAQAYVTPAGEFTDVVTANVILNGWFFDTAANAGDVVKLAKR